MQGTAKKFAILKTVCHENGYQNTDSCIKIKPYAGPRGYAYGFFDVRKRAPHIKAPYCVRNLYGKN